MPVTGLVLAALAAAAAACNVCSGVSVHQEPATVVVLPAAGDLASCSCTWAFGYSAGPTPGKVSLSATAGVGAVAVYGDALGSELIAELPEAAVVEGVVIYSRTGTIRVDLATVASPPAGASLRIEATAINTAPVLEKREGLVENLIGAITVPWSADGDPLPVTLSDDDNFDRGMRAEIELDVGSAASFPTINAVVPFVPGVLFEDGAAGTPSRRVVISGSGSAVETAINNARLIPFAIGYFSEDEITITVSDLGNSGEGSSPLVTQFASFVSTFPHDVVDVPRGSQRLNSGALPPFYGTEAVFLVHDAYEIEFTQLSLATEPDGGGCAEWVRVWDGPDLATARLVSTDLFPTGEICGGNGVFVPTYLGSTGEFVVEFFIVDDSISAFDTLIAATPDGFATWLLGGTTRVEAAKGGSVLVSAIMVTSLPDPADIAVNITVTTGALSLRFADSFVDLIVASTDETLSLALTEADGSPAMLRMGDALREVQYTAPSGLAGDVVLTVDAWSGGTRAATLKVPVVVSEVALNAPDSLTEHAFRPLPVPVAVAGDGDGTQVVAATVRVTSGIGMVSLDPRASSWVDIGYAAELVVSGTLAEVDAALDWLVFKASNGGTDTIVVEVQGVQREIAVEINPDCEGTYILYGREVMFTERAGPPADLHGPDLNCVWFVHGARELRFPFYELTPSATYFEVRDGFNLLHHIFLGQPGVLESPEPYFEATLVGLGRESPGFVGVSQRTSGLNDAPVIVVPDSILRVVRRSTTRLRTLYVDDFTEGVIEASLETDAGSLQEEGTRRINVVAATFEELDAWITGIDFLAGDVQTTATLTLTATDEAEAEAVAQFQIEVLTCDGIVQVVLEDGSETVGVADGSGIADYVDGLACGWRLTGAPGPALLELQYLDLDCGGDGLTVYDGSSLAGRQLGSFCQADQVAAEVGTLVSSTGSFFLELVSNGDGAVGDGFSFVYGAVAAGAATDLGALPRDADPERANATVIALDGASLVVFGGHNGVRAVSTTLVFVVGDGWRVLAGDGPTARSQAAGAAVSGSQIVVHGGVDIGGTVVAETWIGSIDGDTIAWRQLADSGPTTAAAAMVVHDETVHLVDASGVWVLDDTGVWIKIGTTPETVVPTTSAYRRADGLVYATGTDGAVWALSPATRTWTSLGVSLDVECAPWTCSGAMLGPDEYVVDGSRLNVTSLADSPLPTASTGQTVGGQYLGQPSLFVYSAGAMMVVPLTLGVSSHAPLVSPVAGGTTITVSGEQLSTCAAPTCDFGSSLAPAAVATERSASCITPVGAPATVPVTLACRDGRRYSSPDPLAYFAEPTVDSIEPDDPDPGDTVTVTLGGVADATLDLVDSPLCRFDGVPVPATLDGSSLKCAVPESASAGATVGLDVSLDGQQFGSSTSLRLASSSKSLSSSIITVIVVVVAVVVLILGGALIRYRRLATRVSSGPAPWEISFESIELLHKIGSGAFGAVYRGQFRGGEVAVKVSNAESISDDVISAFRKESALMAELRHPNIVLFMGACTEPPNIAIVLEFLPNGSLFDMLHDDTVMISEKQRLSFALDIVKGMAYLHAADPPIIHHDLKSLNVLVDKNFNLKVSDFGMTDVFDQNEAAKRQSDQGNAMMSGEGGQIVGSVHWSAPEVLRGGLGDRASDVYSFGITLWEICTRELPYDTSLVQMIALRVSSDPNFRPTISGPPAMPPFDVIVEKCWADDAAQRPSFASLRTMLSQLALPTDAMSEQTGITGSLVDWAGGPESCAVVIRAVDTQALWENDPKRAHELLEAFRSGVEQLCVEIGGRGIPLDSEAAVCIFETVEDGVKFATSVQECAWAAPGQVSVAGGLAVGAAQQRTDSETQQIHIEGAAVDEAHALVQRSGGGQVLVQSGVLSDDNPDKYVLVKAGGETAMYPASQKDRHAAVVEQQAAAAGRHALSSRPSWMIASDELEIGSLIGAGSFGTVYKAMWRGAPVAAKQLHRKKLGAKEALEFQMEGGVASKLRHPNVCLVLGVCKDARTGKMYVVSEFMSKGSVFETIVTSTKAVAAKIKIKVAKDIALGLRYLHEQSPPIVHRSLTARNVLLAKDWTAKISDFGLARVKTGAATMTKIGSTAYSAPELLRGERYDEQADVYAYGIVVWEMVAQQVAWGGQRLGTVISNVLSGMRPAVKEEWRAGDVKALVEAAERCWKENPSERPRADAL